MKIRGQSRLFPLVFFNSENSITDCYGKDTSIKYSNIEDNLEENIYVFSNEKKQVTNINYCKYSEDESSDTILSMSYIMQIEIYLSNIFKMLSAPFSITSSMTYYEDYIPIISSNIAFLPKGIIHFEKFKQISLPENLYGINNLLVKEKFKTKKSINKLLVSKVSTIFSYMYYDVEEVSEYSIEKDSPIYYLIQKAFEIIQSLKIKQSEIGYIILFEELKEVLEHLNNEYISLEERKNKTLERILSR